MSSNPSSVRATSSEFALARRFFLRVCTDNPFYVLSAVLFLFGLRMSYGGEVEVVQTWLIMGGLAGYTMLLAITAALLVRFANVWDDVRTILLLTVLMFLAISLTFDEALFKYPVRGIVCNLVGLALAVVVTEGVLHTIQLRLPALFRVPYYLALTLFFIYPLTLTGLLQTPRGVRSDTLLWGLAGFSTVAALVTLTLLPAVRRGPRYTADNGSPWAWPLYPWALFGLLGAAVPVRAMLLCFSLDPLMDDDRSLSIFAPYFLTPFALAVAVVLLELGIVSGRRGLMKSALALPALVAVLTLTGYRNDPINLGFRTLFTEQFGCDPLLLTLLAAASFYVYAVLRRVPLADDALTAALAALAFVGPETKNVSTLHPAQPLPVLAAAALQLAIGLERRVVLRCLLGTAGVSAALGLGAPRPVGGSSLQWLVAFHTMVAGLLILGVVFRDGRGRVLRATGAFLVLQACLAATFGGGDLPLAVPAWAVAVYTPLVAAILAGYGLLLDRVSLVVAAVAVVGWLSNAGWQGYGALRQILHGLDHITVSLALFAIAVLVSLGKAGKLRHWLEVWTGVPPSLQVAVGETARNEPTSS
jgi:hypothetical protein